LDADRAPQLKASVMLLRKMASTFLCPLVLCAGVLFVANLAIAQTKNPSPSPTPERREQEEPTEDRIYQGKEVDVKAKLEPLKDFPKPGNDCARRTRLMVVVRAVLHRSGNFTQIKIANDWGCDSFDKDAIRVVGNLKFTPALKDNRPVSTYQIFEFNYSTF
jgi:TonB family protein